MSKMIIPLFIAALFLSSCNFSPNREASLSESSLQNGNYDKPQYEIITEHLTENSDINRISFKYPQLSGEANDFREINQIIKGFVNEILNDYCEGSFDVVLSEKQEAARGDESYAVRAIDFDYRITLKNDMFLSIVFEGFHNAETAAYPTDLMLTLNIDLQKAKAVKLTDVYDINNEFIVSFRTAVECSAYEREVKEYLNKYGDEELTRIFSASDSLDGSAWSYFTDDKLGISFALPHALGDYAVIEIAHRPIAFNEY